MQLPSRSAPEYMPQRPIEAQRLVRRAQRGATPVAMPFKKLAYQFASLVVERRERFIEQPERGIVEAESRKRGAPLLSGRQLLARCELVAGQSNAVEQR